MVTNKSNTVVNLLDYMKKNSHKGGYNRNKLFILIGIPCSGKSYYAYNNFDNPNTVIVSSDELRKETNGKYIFYEGQNKLIHNEAKNRVKTYLSLGCNVVYDATNTNNVYRKSFINIAKKLNSEVIAIVFQTPLEICMERNKQRPIERRVPEEKIMLMSNYNPVIDVAEGFDSVEYV